MRQYVEEEAAKVERPRLRLVGTDGNAFSIMGRAMAALRSVGREDDINAYWKEATAGDYDHLLAVTMRWFDVE